MGRRRCGTGRSERGSHFLVPFGMFGRTSDHAVVVAHGLAAVTRLHGRIVESDPDVIIVPVTLERGLCFLLCLGI